MIYRDDKDKLSPEELAVEQPKSKIDNTLFKERKLYEKTGRFSINTNDYLTEHEKRFSGYSMKIDTSLNQVIVSVVNSSNNLSKPAFGVVKIIKSTANPDINKNNDKWQYLETLTFVCEGKANTSLPKNSEIIKLSNKCPLGYTQTLKRLKLPNTPKI